MFFILQSRSTGFDSPDDYIRELSKLDLSEELLQCLQSLRVSLTGGLLRSKTFLYLLGVQH